MCSPLVIQHVMATLGPADGHSGGRPTADAAARSPATAACFAGVTDLTHPLPETFPSANGERWLRIEDFCSFEEAGINFKIWHMHEHLGTHIDAPIHFSKDGATCDRISARSLVVPLAVVDIRARAAETPDAQLTPDDIRTWESANGELPNGCCLALNSGWDRRASGPGYRNADDTGTMHFPGIHSEAAQMLLEEREVAGLGVDTLSIDHGPSTDFPTHRRWLPAGRWAVEGLGQSGRGSSTRCHHRHRRPDGRGSHWWTQPDFRLGLSDARLSRHIHTPRACVHCFDAH